MSEYTGIKLIDLMLDAAEDWVDAHNNEHREISHSTERYTFDFEMDDFWLQFDTDSDAWYFGVWTNKTHLRTLSYAEGDIHFVQCEDAESYDAWVARMCEAHHPGSGFSTLDTENGKLTRFYQDRAKFFIDPKNCPPSPIQFTEDKPES